MDSQIDDIEIEEEYSILDELVEENENGEETFIIDLDSEPKLPSPDRPRSQQLDYASQLPYETESLEEMDARLDFIAKRLLQAVKLKDYDIGFIEWNHALDCWLSLKYPMKRSMRTSLSELFFQVAITPGMDARIVRVAGYSCMALIGNKKRLNISDLTLDWRPLFAQIQKGTFVKHRETSFPDASILFLLANDAQRFVPKEEIEPMLGKFLSYLKGSNPASLVAVQSFLTHFLPRRHIASYLDAIFRLWQSFNCESYDSQWLTFLGKCVTDVYEDSTAWEARGGRTSGSASARGGDSAGDSPPAGLGGPGLAPGIAPGLTPGATPGITPAATPGATPTPLPGTPLAAAAAPTAKLVSLTPEQLEFIMTKGFRCMGITVDALSSTPAASGLGVHTASDFALAGSGEGEISVQSASVINSFAKILVYTIDGADAGAAILAALRTFLTATEHFFHPANYGAWAPLLCRFTQYLAGEFVARQVYEQRDDCRIERAARLTKPLRREFVEIIRKVALLSMFSRDSLSIAAAEETLMSLAFLEPTLIMPALLDQVYPALETLEETHRTTCAITALSNCAFPLISRALYPQGARHIVPLLELCLPGLDINDPVKTMSTCMFYILAVSGIMIDPVEAGDAMDVDGGDGSDGAVAPVAPDTEIITPTAEDHAAALLSDPDYETELALSTTAFPDWVCNFFRQVLNVFESLPEPMGKHNSTGKTEDTMIRVIIGACDAVCFHLSPPMFDLALDLVFAYVASNMRENAMRSVTQLIACFARTEPQKTLARLVPYACEVIATEICENGAGRRAKRGGGAPEPESRDLTLHWALALLSGALNAGGRAILAHRPTLRKTFRLLVDNCRTERANLAVARIFSLTLLSTATVYTSDYRDVNADEWASASWKAHHHERWGRRYRVRDVAIDWHVPDDEEIAFALEIMEDFISPIVDSMGGLFEAYADASPGSVSQNGASRRSEDTPPADIHDIILDICQNCTYITACVTTTASLAELPVTPTHAGEAATDKGSEDADFIDWTFPCRAGFALRDPQDARFKAVVAFRERVKDMLHRGVQVLMGGANAGSGASSGAGSDGEGSASPTYSSSALKAVISCIKSSLICYPSDPSLHTAAKKTYDFSLRLNRLCRRQKMFPRYVWVRRAMLHHTARVKIHSLRRRRSAADDVLISDIARLCLNPYLDVRKSAQRALDSLATYFDGTRALTLEGFFEVLEDGARDHDAVKGALFVLGSKQFQDMCILDWRYVKRYLLVLLECAAHDNATVQSLVKGIMHDYIIRVAEPSAAKFVASSEGLDAVVQKLEPIFAGAALDSAPTSSDMTPVTLSDAVLLPRAAAAIERRNTDRTAAYSSLMDALLSYLENGDAHWRYAEMVLRLLRALIRRDEPQNPRLARFMAHATAHAELVTDRFHAAATLVKLLHYVKQRTILRGDPILLLRQDSPPPGLHPLKEEVEIGPYPATQAWKDAYGDGLSWGFTVEDGVMRRTGAQVGGQLDGRQPEQTATAGSSDDSSLFFETHATGWFLWPRKITGYRAATEATPYFGNFAWDASSAEALTAVRETVLTQTWWDDYFEHASQEVTEDADDGDFDDQITLMKTLFQIFGPAPLAFVRPHIDNVIDRLGDGEDAPNEHRQRAAAQVLGGLVRGAKHWPPALTDTYIWGWLTEARMRRIFAHITPETQVTWENGFERMLFRRDPRRVAPIVSAIMHEAYIDGTAQGAFDTSKRQGLLGVVIGSFSWRLEALLANVVEMYKDNLEHPFTEVRAVIAENLTSVFELRLHPSYGSVGEFLHGVGDVDGSGGGVLASDGGVAARIDPGAIVSEAAGADTLNSTAALASFDNQLESFASLLVSLRASRRPISYEQGTPAYDKVAITVLSCIWSSITEIRPALGYCAVARLLVEMFQMQELADNAELRNTAARCLLATTTFANTRATAVRTLDTLTSLLSVPSWHVRLDALLRLQSFYMHSLFVLRPERIAQLTEQLCVCLSDTKLEVREAAGKTLSVLVRCSQQPELLESLSARFRGELRRRGVPKRRRAVGEGRTGPLKRGRDSTGEVGDSPVSHASAQAAYTAEVAAVHGAVLGVVALVEAFPYDVPRFVPPLLVECMTQHAASPPPISTAVKTCLTNFKQSHSDSWETDKLAFDPEQLTALHDLLAGSSYYA